MCCADWGVPLGGNGGSSVHFRSLAKALASLGHDIRLVVSNRSGPVEPSFPVDSVPYRRFWPALHSWAERMRGRETSSSPDFLDPAADLVQKNPLPGPAPQNASGLSWKARLYYQDLPRVLDRAEELFFHQRSFGRAVAREVSTFRPHAIYERYSLGQTGAVRAARSGSGAPVPHLLEVNASLATERSGQKDLSGLWAWWSRASEQRQWRSSDRVFCVSKELKDLVTRAGTESAAVRVVPNGVDVEEFSPERPTGALRQAIGADNGEVLIGWLGSLAPGRGAEEFLRMLALVLPKVDKARGVVIGGGRLDEECRRLAQELGIAGRVAFVGPVAHELVPSLLVDLDVAVACYPRQDGFYFSPMKVAEYLACGLAVVVGRTGQMAELVQDGMNGLLVEPGDLPAWAGAVISLCQDPARRADLGKAARRTAMAGPTWERNARIVEQEILSCQKERTGEARP